MSFRPAGKDHAIVSSSFTIGLSTPMPDEIFLLLKSRKNEWADALPAIREMKAVEVQVRPDGARNIRQMPAIEFAFLRPDGTPTWLLRIDGTDILVECTLYTRWEKVWGQARAFLANAMTALAGANTEAKSLTFQVIDRFESDNEERASSIFAQTAQIDPRLRESESLWHQHLGWLQQIEQGQLLHNVNIDVLPREPAGKQVNLLHLQRLTLDKPMTFGAAETNLELLDTVAASMHLENKELLRGLLSEESKTAIKLDPTP